MNEGIKSAGMYLITGVVSAVAGHYHASPEQTAQLLSDALYGLALLSGLGGVKLHLAAYRATPPAK